MKRIVLNCIFSITFILTGSYISAQTGPGGVGNSDGSDGQPVNLIWLDASELISFSSGDVWSDKSGNGYNATHINEGGNVPTLGTINAAFKTLNFDGTASYLRIPDDDAGNNRLDGMNNLSILAVYNPGATDTRSLISKRLNVSNRSWALIHNSGYKLTGYAGTTAIEGATDISGGFGFSSYIMNGSLNLYHNGDFEATGGSGLSIPDRTENVTIGRFDESGSETRWYDGEVAEIVVYSDALNTAQRIILENYFSAKYNLAFTTAANDKMTGNASGYIYDVAGIGQGADGNHLFSACGNSGLYILSTGDLDEDDYIMFAHNNDVNTTSTNDITGSVAARWSKDWYIEQTQSSNAQIIFDLPEGISGDYPQNISNYVLLYRSGTTGDYSIATTSGVGYRDADQIAFDILGSNLADGYYTLGTIDQTNSPVEGAVGTTWYSLISGDWSDPDTWTLDPSGALPNNPDNSYPQNTTDKVVIKSGKTVTMDLVNPTAYLFASVTVNGRLDLKDKNNLTFTEIKGTGRILMSDDVFPSYTDADDFIKAGQGEGTVVLYGDDFVLGSSAYEFYNLEVEMNAGQTVVLTKDLTLNGDMRIETGTFQINDASTTNLNISVKGNVDVLSGAYLHTGGGNARHQFNFYGDLTNAGELEFTNRTTADYDNEAIDGIVDANFLSGISNQTISCNGVSNFYRIEIDKGNDKTYILSIEASTSGNFNLLGTANEGHANIAQLTENNNALGLIKGTVKIGANVNIPVLNNDGNYNISEAAQFWVTGGTVTKSVGLALVPYGIVRVSSGTLEALVSSGITLRENGLILVEGGTLNTNQIRTSVLGTGNIGGYVQSGGTVNVVSGATHTEYYHFSLTYVGNVFNMSGGTLHVYNANGTATNQGGIFIASDPENVSVTGGTVIAEVYDNANTFKITSKAPFWDLILRNSNDAATNHLLDGGSNINSTSDADLLAQPLVVYNDFTIEDNCFFDHNGQNVTIGRNFSIAEGSQQEGTNNRGYLYDSGTPNTTVFNGAENGTVYIGESRTNNGYELYLTNMTIEKPVGGSLLLTGDVQKEAGTVSTLYYARLIQVTGDFILKSGTFNQGEHAVRLYGTVEIDKDGILGVYTHGTTETNACFVFRGDGLTVNTEEGAKIGNFKMDVTTPATHVITFTSDVEITRLGYTDGRINMGTHNLKIDYLHDNYSTNWLQIDDADITSSGGAFYFAGNASDGGLSLLVSENNTYQYPIGVSGKFTPVEVVLTSYSDDGYLTVTPVDHYLWTLTGGSANVLDYYWNIDYYGFSTLPDVQSTFYYLEADVDGNDNSYRAARVINFTTIEELGNGSVDDTNNEIIYENGELTSGDYTAGSPSVFNASVRKLYARQNGLWHDNETWSTTRDGLNSLNNNQVPEPGDICIIGTDATNYTVAVDATDAAADPVNVAMVVILRYGSDESSLLTIGQSGSNCNFGVVTNKDPDAADPESTIGHACKIIVSGPDIPSGDFGDFLSAENAIWTYSRAYPGSTRNVYDENDVLISNTYYSSYTIGSSITEYPTLQFEYSGYNSGYIELPDVDITVNNDIRFWHNDHHVIFNNSANGGDVTVMDDITFNGGNSWNVEFQGSGTERILEVNGDIDFNNNAGTYSVENLANDITHKIRLAGNVINPAAGSDFNCYNGAGNANADFEFFGEQNSDFADMAGIPSFNQLIMNKGTDQTYYALTNSNISLGGDDAGTSEEKPIQLENGTLILNNSSINLDLSTADEDFVIPATTCLESRLGKVYINGGTGISLDGKLLVRGGTVDMLGGDNYIEYSASGSAEIEVISGALNVGSQVRRSLSSDQGILKYSQSGGTVNIGVSAAGQDTRAIFEILNTGSSFTHSGGNFNLVNDYRSNPSIQSLYFAPETVNLSSGTVLTFGGLSTEAAEKDFTIYAGKSLMNLTLDNTSTNDPILTLETVPLTLEENLNINSGTTFDANGVNLNISGNFTNSGTFRANGNTSTFEGTNAQLITGATTFYNLTKSTSNDLSLASSSEILVENVLSLENGTFDDNDNNVNVKGDLYCDITTSSSGSSDGIILNSDIEEQQITGNGTFARLTINNPDGIVVPTGNNLTVTDNLKMQTGVLNIGRNLLELTQDASIEEAGAFGESNMIQTNLSFTDAGVRKYFPLITSSTQFIYPMGSQGKYTPVKFDIAACDAGGSIRVRAADERHISIVEDSETPEIADTANVLWYHWTLDADNISGFTATATMDYYPDDAKVEDPPYTLDDYITASLIDANAGLWTKYPIGDFNKDNNELYFEYNSTNDLGIDGDYTAGIDDAIPDKVPSYISKQDGPWNDENTWDTYPVSGGTVPAGGPRGAIMYIEHNVTMPSNFMAAYKTNIRSSGTVSVGTTFGHRLGIVNGTGTLYMQRGDLPAGVYDGFFAPDSGTIVFNGSTDYDILSEITYVNNLTVIGSGERRFPNLDLTIYGDLVIGDGGDTPELINEHNSMLNIYKNIYFNSGSFDAGFGDDAIVSLTGNSHQTINGDFTGTNAFYHFQMNNPSGASLTSSDIEIDNGLLLTSGVLFSTDANTITLKSSADNIITGGSNSSHVSGPLFKNITNGSSFDFPVGNSGRYGKCYVESDVSNSAGFWQAQYYNDNPGNAGYDPAVLVSPLIQVSTNEYWRVQAPAASGYDAVVGLRWDNQSSMPVDVSNIANLRIAEWQSIPDPDSWVGLSSTNSGAGTTGTIVISANVAFDEFGTGNFFTLASEAPVVTPEWEGDVSTEWNDAGNWSTSTVPTAADDVIIQNIITYEPTITTNAVCATINLYAGRTLTISPTGSLRVSGINGFTMNGNVTIESDATGTGALIDAGFASTNGTATVQRYTTGNSGDFIYHYISSPLSSVPNSIFSIAPWGDPNPNFYVYDEKVNSTDILLGWDNPTAIAGDLTVGRGYAHAYTENTTYEMTGGDFNTGDITFPVTYTNNNTSSLDGWNLIGNPYPSAISADDFISANTGTIEGTLYFWDDDASEGSGYSSDDYATWNLAGAIGTGTSGSSSSTVPDGYITSGQGFFVHAHSSGNVDFSNSMRRIGNGQFFKKSKVDEVFRVRISISNESEKLYNEALVTFIHGATDGYDNFYDARKIIGNPNIAFYSLLDKKEYAIQSFKKLNERDNNVKEVALGYKVSKSGTYSFNAVELENIADDLDVYFEDKLTKTTISLKDIQTYSFKTEAGTFNNRFLLRFNYQTENTNNPPLVRNKISDAYATEDLAFDFTIPLNTFADLDNDEITYSTKLASGEDLPLWLTFNRETLEFTGTPENDDVGVLTVEVFATDEFGESGSDVFNIGVVNVNDVPQVINAIEDQNVDENSIYNYNIPDDIFIDIDHGDKLALVVTMSDGSDLPGWLFFDNNTNTLSGTAENPGELNLLVVATDLAGESASTTFVLRVNKASGVESNRISKIKVYPNPVYDYLYVKTSVNEVGAFIKIIDSNGKIIIEKVVENTLTEFNLSDEMPGFYFIEINKGQRRTVLKVILDR